MINYIWTDLQIGIHCDTILFQEPFSGFRAGAAETDCVCTVRFVSPAQTVPPATLPAVYENSLFRVTGMGETERIWYKNPLNGAFVSVLEEPSVDLRDGTPFPEALRRLREQTAAVTLSEDCATCAKHSHCCVCPAMLYTESGSFDRVPHYLCRFTKELIRLASEEPIPEGLTGNPETIRNEGAEELC